MFSFIITDGIITALLARVDNSAADVTAAFGALGILQSPVERKNDW